MATHDAALRTPLVGQAEGSDTEAPRLEKKAKTRGRSNSLSRGIKAVGKALGSLGHKGKRSSRDGGESSGMEESPRSASSMGSTDAVMPPRQSLKDHRRRHSTAALERAHDTWELSQARYAPSLVEDLLARVETLERDIKTTKTTTDVLSTTLPRQIQEIQRLLADKEGDNMRFVQSMPNEQGCGGGCAIL